MIVFVFFLLLIYDGEALVPCNHPLTPISWTTVPGTGYSNDVAARSLRISTDYDPSFTSMSDQDFIIRLIINPAIQFWQDAIQVKYPLSSSLLIDRSCPSGDYLVKNRADTVKVCSSYYCSNSACYTTKIPSQYLKKCYTQNYDSYNESGSDGSGAYDTDLLILVTQIATGCSSNTLAYGLACRLENIHDRPVLGVMNICPGQIDLSNGVEEAVAVLKHNIAHILGVSSNLFAFYRDECDNPRTPRDSLGYPNLGMKRFGYKNVYSFYQYNQSTVLDTTKRYLFRTGPVLKEISYIVTPTVRVTICNTNRLNIEPQCNYADRPCTGPLFAGACGISIKKACIPMFFWSCKSAHVSMISYKIVAFLCSILSLINDFITI